MRSADSVVFRSYSGITDVMCEIENFVLEKLGGVGKKKEEGKAVEEDVSSQENNCMEWSMDEFLPNSQYSEKCEVPLVQIYS